MYLCVDTETGSLKPVGNVLQIHVEVCDENWNSLGVFSEYCKPIKPELVEKKALQINKINIEKIEKDAEQVQSELLDFLKSFNSYLRFVAYNSSFDWKQIEVWLRLLGNHWEFERIVSKINHLDVLKVARQHKFKSYKLENVASELGVHKKGAHNAEVDVKMMIDVAKRLYKKEEFEETVDLNRKYIDSKYIIFTHDGEFLLKQAAFENQQAFEYIWNYIKVRGKL